MFDRDDKEDSIGNILLSQLRDPEPQVAAAAWDLLFETVGAVKDHHEIKVGPFPVNDPLAPKCRFIDSIITAAPGIDALEDNKIRTLRAALDALRNDPPYRAYTQARGAAKQAIKNAWQAINHLKQNSPADIAAIKEQAAIIKRQSKAIKKLDKDNKKLLKKAAEKYQETANAIKMCLAESPQRIQPNELPEILKHAMPDDMLRSSPAKTDNPSDKTTLGDSYKKKGLRLSACLYTSSKSGGANNPGEHGGNYQTLIWDNKERRLKRQLIFFKQATDDGMPNFRESISGVLAGNIMNACIGNLGASGFFSRAPDNSIYAASIFHDRFKDIHESAHKEKLPWTPNRAAWKFGGQWISIGNPFFQSGMEKIVRSDPSQAENLGRVMAANLLVANYQLHGNNVGMASQTVDGKTQNNICGIDSDGAFRRDFKSKGVNKFFEFKSKEVSEGQFSTEIRPYHSKTRKHSTDYLAAYPDSIKLSAEFIQGIESVVQTSREEIKSAVLKGIEYAHQYFSPEEFTEFSTQLDTRRTPSATPKEEKEIVEKLLENTLVARQHSLSQWALELKVAHTLGGYKKAIPPTGNSQYSMNQLIHENYFSFLLNQKAMKKNLKSLGIEKNQLKKMDKIIKEQLGPENPSLTVSMLRQQLIEKIKMDEQFINTLSDAVVCQMANIHLRHLMPAHLRSGIQDTIAPTWKAGEDIPDSAGTGSKMSRIDTHLSLTDSELQQFIRQMAGNNAVNIAEFKPTITLTAGNAPHKISHIVSVIEMDQEKATQKGHVTPPRTSARLLSVTSEGTNRLYATPSLMHEISKDSAAHNYENLYRMVNAAIEKAITDLESTGPNKVTTLQMTPQAGTTAAWLAMMQYCCTQKGINFKIDPHADSSKVVTKFSEDLRQDIEHHLGVRSAHVGVIRPA